MGIFNKILNRNHLKTSINQSIHLQANLKILSLSYPELEAHILEILQTNQAVDFWEEPSRFSSHDMLQYIPQTKKEVLFEQIPTKLLSSNQKVLCEEIFQSLSEEGFLFQEEKIQLIQKHGSSVLHALALIQQYTHLGFDSRIEYWKYLLQQQGEIQTVLLIEKFFKELSEADFSPIIKALKISKAEFKDLYLDKFKKLPLSPQAPLSLQTLSHKVDIEISLNDDYSDIDIKDPMPAFTLAQAVISDDKSVKSFYRPFLDELKELKLSVKKRSETLEKVANIIVREQKEYLLGNESSPRPLCPKQVAEELTIHPSTLARCIQNKTLLCMHGIIELKTLITPSHMEDNPKDLLLKLKQLVTQEDKTSPYSDEKLLQILREKGAKISRRTVTKYRQKLKIPDARRRFFS